MIVRRRLFGAMLAAGIGLAGSSPAWALDAQAFAPAVDPHGYFSVYSSKAGPQGRFHVSVWTNVADDVSTIQVPIPGGILDPDLTQEVKAVDELYTIDVVASVSVLDFLELMVDVPVSKVTSDLAAVEDGFGIDDVQLLAKLQLVDSDVHGFGMAFIPFGDVPTGDEDRLTSNDEFDWGGRLVFDLDLDAFRTSLNVGYRTNDKLADDGDGDPDDIFYGLAFGLEPVRNAEALGGILEGAELLGEAFGSTPENDVFKTMDTTPLEIMGGVRFYTTWGVYITLGLGGAPYDSVNAPKIRGLVGIDYTPPPPKPAPPPPPPAAPPPPPPPPPPAKVVVTDEQLILLEPVYFDFDRATIKTVSYPILDEVVKVMTDKPDIKVRVEGHTDSRGSDPYNQNLSQKRTESVVRYLVQHGVDATRLQAKGFGESRPAATNDTDEGRAKNRRTEFHIVK